MGVKVKPELRLKIRDRKFLVPDVMALFADAPRTRVVETTPLHCIEIISQEDHLPELIKRAEDYLAIGGPQPWTFNPETKKAYIFSTAAAEDEKAQPSSVQN